MKQYTDITVLLDRSGSMDSIKGAMEEAFNTFIKEHKVVPSTKVTLVQFDTQDNQEVVFQGVPVGSVEKLNLKPRGGTPLVDALCTLIDRTGLRLASMDEKDRPDQVLFVIITDGEENASRTFKRQDAFNRITNQHNNFKWQFIYLGANQDAIQEAASLGIPSQWAYTFQPTTNSIAFMNRSLVGNTVAYACNTEGLRSRSVAGFTDEQREEPTLTTTTTGDLNE